MKLVFFLPTCQCNSSCHTEKCLVLLQSPAVILITLDGCALVLRVLQYFWHPWFSSNPRGTDHSKETTESSLYIKELWKIRPAAEHITSFLAGFIFQFLCMFFCPFSSAQSVLDLPIRHKIIFAYFSRDLEPILLTLDI